MQPSATIWFTILSSSEAFCTSCPQLHWESVDASCWH
jgi:hypothetical protein